MLQSLKTKGQTTWENKQQKHKASKQKQKLQDKTHPLSPLPHPVITQPPPTNSNKNTMDRETKAKLNSLKKVKLKNSPFFTTFILTKQSIFSNLMIFSLMNLLSLSILNNHYLLFFILENCFFNLATIFTLNRIFLLNLISKSIILLSRSRFYYKVKMESFSCLIKTLLIILCKISTWITPFVIKILKAQ